MIRKSILCCIAIILAYSPYALSSETVPSELNSYYAMGTYESSVGDGEMQDHQSMKKISNAAYIGGGVASIFVGFGIGTAIQGRYDWTHTLLQGLAVGGLVTAAVVTVGDAVSSAQAGKAKINWTSMSLYLGFGLLLGGLRIYEVIDTWMLPDDYRVVKEPVFQILPLASYEPEVDSYNLGLSMRYKF